GRHCPAAAPATGRWPTRPRLDAGPLGTPRRPDRPFPETGAGIGRPAGPATVGAAAVVGDAGARRHRRDRRRRAGVDPRARRPAHAAARPAPVSTHFRVATASPAARHRPYHSRVASDAHGVASGPTFVPMTRASRVTWLATGTTASPAT